MASPPSANNLMERSNRSQDPLQCPRCSSSNTKFCYYNNYSLSQPRHYCKACKRYWTRGGTLRNVPVGGGCRKNKKLNKRQPPSSGGGDGISSTPATSTAAMKSSISAQPDTDQLSPTSNRINNPLFCIDFPFSAFNHQHQISDANPVFFGSSTFANSAPTSTRMSSLLASAIQQPRISTNGVKGNDQTFSSLMPSYKDVEMVVGNGEIGKELNIVGGENCMLAWNSEQIDQQINSSDSSSLLWNANNVGAWFDPSNMGSSVPSLI